MSVVVRIADSNQTSRHVRKVPCVDGSGLAREIFTSRAWSVQPCVRPVDAVHMTAGHNAFRGSGPGQNLAFDNALALVGCPDRLIDRLCITCCLPSQPSHHAGCPARSRLRRKRDGLLVTLALGHHGPARWKLKEAAHSYLVGNRVVRCAGTPIVSRNIGARHAQVSFYSGPMRRRPAARVAGPI